MYEVFLTNMGYTHSSHRTLDSAIRKARSTGFTCHIFKQDNPFKILKTVCPIRGS